MNRPQTNCTFGQEPLLELVNINLSTPDGRPLFHDLNMIFECEKVAIIGRNGAGKSTLLKTMQGDLQPNSGEVRYRTKPHLVPQQISSKNDSFLRILLGLSPVEMLTKEFSDAGLASLIELKPTIALSFGQIRKLHLLVAKLNCPGMLLLDEPTEELDEAGVKWLIKWISSWENGLIVVSHDRELLSHFNHFFIISESGCSYFSGTFSELSHHLEREAYNAETRYIQNVHMLSRKEEHRVKMLRRPQRKKNFGPISELERCTPRQRLNKKRGKAQVSQGKAAKISQDRISAVRKWTLASRRALTVSLPLELPVPEIDTSDSKAIIRLEAVSAKVHGRFLFREVHLSVGYERFAIVGPNGAGKTTLLNIILGNVKPFSGNASNICRFNSIAQGGANWMTEESLLSIRLALDGTGRHTLLVN